MSLLKMPLVDDGLLDQWEEEEEEEEEV